MSQLRDIKPYLAYNEWLYWTMTILGMLALLIFIGIVWWSISKWLLSREHNIRKKYFQAIKSVDWSNPKRAAYSITYYGRLLAKDARSAEIFDQLEPMLQEYKYKKDVPSVNDETLSHYNLFIQVLDV
ncbi:MAG: hypothetical protein PHE73_06990 [Sulfurovaceae bacterium]|nr:hypothetical protein [Sulfurovaceae bacterium]